jgi:2-aminoethylphosphonate-pyruvate transaminase
MSTTRPRIKRNILLNPGPATTTDSVKYAQVVPDICHREREFANIVQEICATLTTIASTSRNTQTILIGGSGTAAIESVLSSIFTTHHHAYVISNGAYGERLCQILDCYNVHYTAYKSDPCTPLNHTEIKHQLANSQYTHLLAVHHETTTGLLNNIHSLGQIASQFNLSFIVDAMSAFGAIPIDMNIMHIDYLISSSNKNIQGMAGIGIVLAKKKALNTIKDIPANSFYLNLYKQYQSLSTTGIFQFTPPVQTIYALQHALVELKEEGIQNRYNRYISCWETLIKGLKKLGLKTLVDHKHHSKLLTTVVEPEHFDFTDCHDYLYDHGFTIYPGKINHQTTFRIANMGDLRADDIKSFLVYLERYLNKKNII